MHGPVSTTLAQPLAAFDLIPGLLGDRAAFTFQTIVLGGRSVIVVHRRTVFAEQDRVAEMVENRVVAPVLDRVVTASRRSATVRPSSEEC